MLVGLPEWQFDVVTFTQIAGLLACAFLLALPVGWDREQADRSAGLRTFPLVAVSACAFLTMSRMAFAPDAQARVMQGLITGIGFVGGGAILKDGSRVRGTATAASIWTTGAIGAAVALGRLDVALALSAITFATLRWLHGVTSDSQKSEPGQRSSNPRSPQAEGRQMDGAGSSQ